MTHTIDIIDPAAVGTLPGLFRERVRRTPDACAYKRFTGGERCCEEVSWSQVLKLAGRWQAALRQENLNPGDRVAVMLKNCLEWVLFDLAAMGLGLVTVPLFVNDRPDELRLHPGPDRRPVPPDRRDRAVAADRRSRRPAARHRADRDAAAIMSPGCGV